MKIFNSIINEVHAYKEDRRQKSLFRESRAGRTYVWPRGNPSDIILKPDLAVEFGDPESASVSFVVWTEDLSLITDRRITLIGNDVGERETDKNPFGKVVIAGVKGVDETNAFDRNRELHMTKFDISLKGHMLRSASHYLAEWHRISRAAVKDGFSFYHLGSALIEAYKRLDYVVAAEVVFVTVSNEAVTQLYDCGKRSARIINAMSKMVYEMNYDCSSCTYQDICKDAQDLRRLREKLAPKKREIRPGGGCDN